MVAEVLLSGILPQAHACQGDSKVMRDIVHHHCDWQVRVKCGLLGKAERVKAPTALPTVMESAFTRPGVWLPKGNQPATGRGGSLSDVCTGLYTTDMAPQNLHAHLRGPSFSVFDCSCRGSKTTSP